MTTGDRVKYLRKELLHLSGEKFAEPIGVGKSSISNIENNSRELTDQMRKSICHYYNVSEEWLLTGNGEPFVSVTKNQEIAEWVVRVLSDQSKRTQAAFLAAAQQAPDEAWEHAGKFLTDFFKALDE